MYVPDKFAVDDATVRGWIRDAGLAQLVTVSADGTPEATPVPFVYRETDEGWGSLVGHIARVNPQWKDAGERALVIIGGPQHYVTPDWQPSTRVQHKTVPTWDYEQVNVSGRLIVRDDTEWVERQVRHLAAHHEPQHGSDWDLDKTPARYRAGQLRAIVGVEIVIESVTGKMKMGQDRPAPDQVSIAEHLRAEGREASAAEVEKALAIGETRRAARAARVAEVHKFRGGDA